MAGAGNLLGGARELRRRFRTKLHEVGFGYSRGTEPVAIDDLISPLRYDILVRQRFFEFLGEHHQLYDDDLPRLVELSRAQAYHDWYVKVEAPHFLPNKASRLEEAFADRVAATVRLYRSVIAEGFDDEQPVKLRTGRAIAPTATGKRIACRVFPGDGCHRLALLRSKGVTVLEPGRYIVHTQRRFVPWDMTVPLLAPLGVDRESYWRFMALAYGDLVADDYSGPAENAAASDPARCREMLDVAASDTPLLSVGTRATHGG